MATDRTRHTIEERYGALVRHASDIITLLTADGTVLYQSPAIRRVLGYDPATRVGADLFSHPLVHPDDLASKRRFLAAAVEQPGETVAATFRLHHADGSWRTIEALGVNLLDDPAVGGIVATYRDVTDARRREERQRFLAEAGALLAESLDYERTLARVARLSLPLLADWCAIDLADELEGVRRVAVAHADPAREGALREMSRRYPPATDDPSPVREVLHSGRSLFFPEITAAQAAALVRDAEHARLTALVGLAAGMVVPLRARGRTFGALSLVAAGERRYDLDDLALAEELSQRAALAVDSARLFQAEQVARSRAERVAARDKALYAVTSALSAALTPERTGAVVIEQGQAALGAVAGLLALLADDGTVLEIVAESGYAAAAVAPWHRIPLDAPIPLAAAARTGVPLYYESYAALIAAYPHLAHGVRTGHEAVAALPLRVEGRAIGVLGLSFAGVHPFAAEDLAFMGALADQSAQALERARLYAGEARARQAAEDLARQRQEFVATASHELKTPLTTLLGHVELLGRQLSRPVPDTARVNRYLGVLQSAAGRLGALVDDLLDTARIQQGYLALRLAPCDLVVIARDVLQRAEESIERTARHTLALDAPTSVPGVWDGERLDQVLSNLVSNALKYSPDGGEVRVRVVPTPEDVAIVVSDQGIGIAPDETTLLFEPFARGRILREMVGGTGLGLYIVRQNIEQHGGAIVIESTPGVGTTITVRLPRGTATAADAPASGGRPEPSNP